MSKLNVDQKSIFDLLSDRKNSFLIPDYQRPYEWSEEQCQTLWDDIFLFSFPDNDCDAFDENEEYFLGSIVTFKNEESKLEVIDGQQRLTTILLLLRAFYEKFGQMQDKNSKLAREMIEKCIWKTDAFGTADKNILKIDSEVATDDDKSEFLNILKTGVVASNNTSQYSKNFTFFNKKIQDFLNGFSSYFPYLPARILNNCILLPIEAESQNTALRIFSTLNDRGLPLSDADIFKAQFYKFYKDINKKDEFIDAWKELEALSALAFNSTSVTPMDELFTRYMYFLRALDGNKRTTTEALRKFFERNKYAYLKNVNTIKDLKKLALFWNRVNSQDQNYFDNKVLKKLFVLNFSPNGMWQNILSVYFLKYSGEDEKLDQEKFFIFLESIIAFTFTYALTNPGLNSLRTPAYDEMVNIVTGKFSYFNKYKFEEDILRNLFDNYIFSNQRTITRSLLTWHAYSFDRQELIDRGCALDIEHIYSKKRQEMEEGLSNYKNIDSLGNKILLESSINIRASDYRFEDKKAIYQGEVRRGKHKGESKIFEIKKIIEHDNFGEIEIIKRGKDIVNNFIEFVSDQNLLMRSN